MPYTDIDVKTAHDVISDGIYPNLIILDVRTQSEYEKGHLKKSILIPVTALKSRINELSQYINTEIIVYCHIGSRSSQASKILDSNNFTKIYNILGGIKAWESANYSVIS